MELFTAITCHAGQLWTENSQVAVLIEPNISLQSWKS